MAASMKAAFWTGTEQIEVKQVARPTPGPGQALIKVAYGGICGTDLMIYLGKHPRSKAPMVMCHEFSGTIVEADGFTALGYGFEKSPFDEGAQAFGNREYVWKDVPDRLNDYGAFTRTHGGERGRIFVRAKRDCTVYVATAHGASGYDMLKWTPIEER